MSYIIPIPHKYLQYVAGPRNSDSNKHLVLGITPEIDEFVTSTARLGKTLLVCARWPHAFAVRFEHEGDAALFQLTFPHA